MAEIPLSYIGNVNLAVRIVTDKYPGALLFEVDSSTPDQKLTEDPKDLSKLRAVFAVPKEKDPNLFGTAFIYQTTWGEWSPPTYNEHMWVGDRVIPWPIDFELNDAVKVFREAGYTQFLNVTLRWPLSLDGEEPYYIFGTPDGFVFVGVYTHKIPGALKIHEAKSYPHHRH